MEFAMNIEEKLLHILFSKPKNKIQNIYGFEKKIIDSLLVQSVLKKTFKHFRENPLFLIDYINFIDSQIFLGKNFKHNKYVYFNGNIFIDCFAPKWPGKAFYKLLDTLIYNLGKEPSEWTPFIPYLVFSITKKCVYRCEHCYAIQSLGNKDIMSVEELLRIAKDFQKIGVGVIAWEGGEPLLRFDDLLFLIKETHSESEAWIATTGYGLSSEKAQRLKDAGLTAAIISIDHYNPDKHNKFRRNKKAFDMAVNGVKIFRENGILPCICICATKDIMEEDGLFKYLELAKEIGAAFVQILDATPSGNYIGQDVLLSNSQLEEIKKFHIKVNTDLRYKDYPGISARALLEDDNHYGCCAGNGLCYVDSSGNVQACDLLQISLGNLLEEDVEVVYKRIKEYFPHFIAGRCPAQTLYKDIANIYNKTNNLPLLYNDCSQILEKIKKRNLPKHLQKVHNKLKRENIIDFIKIS